MRTWTIWLVCLMNVNRKLEWILMWCHQGTMYGPHVMSVTTNRAWGLYEFICNATSENDYSNLHIQHFPNLRSAGEVGKIKGEELATPPNSAWRQKNSANLIRSYLFSSRVATFLTTQPTIRVTMLNFGDSANLFLLCQLNSTLSFLFYDVPDKLTLHAYWACGVW